MIFTKQVHTMQSLYSLPEVPTPTQVKNSDKWAVIPHAWLVEALISEADRLDLKPGALSVHVSPEGKDMACSMAVKLSTGVLEGVGCIGLVNDHNWKSAVWMYGGVLVPDAGIPLMRVQVGRHVKNFDPKKKVLAAMEKLADNWKEVRRTVEMLTRKEVSSGEAEIILEKVALGRSPLCTKTKAQITKLVYRREREKTAWNLVRCFAETLASSNPIFQMKNVFLFHREVL